MGKIAIDEADIRKIILMLKLSKPYLDISKMSDNLALYNMWRVSRKLSDKLMRKANLKITVVKGRVVLKPKGENETEAI